jgi:hypothetical protein
MPDVNLIPAARLARRRRNTRLCVWGAICGAYAMCLIAGSATLQALRANEDRGLHGQLATLTQQTEQDNAQMLECRKELAEATLALETARTIGDQPDWSRLFLGLSEQLGDELVLSQCRLATLTGENRVVAEQWAESLPAKPLGTLLTECRHTLQLGGFGSTQEAVSRFVLRLEHTGLFRIVRLVSSCRQTFLDKEAVAFSVECDLKGP